jgi:hypothetical protein
MDNLEIVSIEFAKEGQVARIEAIPVHITLQCNNWTFPDALDISEFFKSLRLSGLSPLFTCAVCGVFCCSGYYVDIRASADNWQISNRYECSNPDKLIEAFTFQIPWWQIRRISAQIQEAIQRIPQQHPHLQQYVGTTRIPSAERIDELVSECPFGRSESLNEGKLA